MFYFLRSALKPDHCQPFRGQNDYIPKSAQNEVRCVFRLLQCCKKWYSKILIQDQKYFEFWAEINKKTGHDAFFNWKCSNPPSHKFWKVLCVQHCHICKQNTPAPIRRGFVLRMCTWCFQHCTVSEQAVAQCFPHHIKYLKHLRRDFTWLKHRNFYLSNRKQKLHGIFLLQDVVQILRELPPYDKASIAIKYITDLNNDDGNSTTA